MLRGEIVDHQRVRARFEVLDARAGAVDERDAEAGADGTRERRVFGAGARREQHGDGCNGGGGSSEGATGVAGVAAQRRPFGQEGVPLRVPARRAGGLPAGLAGAGPGPGSADQARSVAPKR